MEQQQSQHFDDQSSSKLILDRKLYSQLKLAVKHGQKENVELLLQQNAPVNAPTGMYNTHSPLLSSVYLGNPDITSMLLRKGASVNTKHVNSETCLTLAAKLEKYAIVDLLLLADGLENCQNYDKITHLHIACMRNSIDVVKKLILSKEDINAAVESLSFYWPGFTPLHFAVQFGCIETVEYLLSIGADITAQDVRKLTPLHLADMHRSEQIIDLILQAHKNVVSNPKNKNNLSHFHIACTRNNLEVIEHFIKIGVDLEEPIQMFDFSCYTPVDLAIYYDCIDVVRLLLLHGAHIKSNVPSEVDRIEDAYDSGNLELVNLLLKENKIINGKATNAEKIPDFHISCMHDSFSIIRQSFPEIPFSLNGSHWNGCTPLHFAVGREDQDFIRFLIRRGADFSIVNDRGDSPLHLAFDRGMELVDLILTETNEVHLNPVNSYGLSHLHIFCASKVINNKPAVIEDFMKLGFDINCPVHVNSTFWPGFTPLHFAVKFGRAKVVRILLANGANYSATDRSGLSAFDWCIRNSYQFGTDKTSEMMEILLSYHSDRKLHPFDDHGYSLLHILSMTSIDQLKRMRDLIEKNPSDLNKVICKSEAFCGGYTPLHFAMNYGNQKQAKLLIELGANPLIQDADGDTPLHLAFESEYGIFFVFNCQMKIPISLQDSHILRLNPMGSTGYTLFHIACGMGNIKLMKSFLQHGVDISSPTNLCNTEFKPEFYDRKPLHLAIRHTPPSSVKTVKFLLENGADVHARDSKMNTPLHYMRCNNKIEIINMLVSHGADINALNANFETPILRTSFNAAGEIDDVIAEKIAFFLNNGADINLADEKGDTPLTVYTWINNPDEFLGVAEVLLKHVLKLETIGHFVSEANIKGYCELLEEFSDRLQFDEISVRQSCSIEFERMAQSHIANQTTLLDVLSKSLNDLAVISENEVFVEIVSADGFHSKFPIYGLMLESQLRRGRARRPLLSRAHKALNFLTGKSLPSVCTEMIFQSFNNEDLQFVILSKEKSN